MNGLRIFVDEYLSETQGGVRVFYSRRADGPLYRWSYAGAPQQWRAERMHSSDISPRDLCLSKWKSVPAPLQKTLNEHYQD